MMRLLLAFFLLFIPPAWAEVAVPPLQSRVTDLARTLSPGVRQQLENRLAALEQAKGAQLAVLIVPSTQPETIEQYSLRVAETWKLGRKGVDDGALLLLAREDRALRIETGYGLEGALPDAIGKRIIEDRIIPRLKAGDFDGGVSAGVDAMIARVNGEALPETAASGKPPDGLMPEAMVLVLVIGGLMRAFFGRLVGASLAAAIAFFGVVFLAGTWLFALFLAVVAFVLTLAGGGSGRGRGGFGGGIGGGGGGGFRGGGGGFGGGGASGRW